jgi:elongation factor P
MTTWTRHPSERATLWCGTGEGFLRDRLVRFPTPLAGVPPALERRAATDVDESEDPPVASTNDLKNGLVLNLEGQLWTVVEFQHVKPGKGPAFVRTKLKNVLSGKVVDKTFNAGVKVETANVDKRNMQYLYNDGTDFIFMDGDTYDQISVTPEVVGDAAKYMLENQEAIVARHDGAVLFIELPASVVLEISYTEPGLQGDRSTGGTKPATLETGAEIAVPLFLETGTKVKVDTRDGSYLGRVS